jgi:hypothetical protein
MISNGSTGGMKYTGDIECDDAIDALWNIDDGRLVHEEDPEVLRVILMRCRNLIAEDVEKTLGCERNTTSPVASYANPKIQTFLSSVYSSPVWMDRQLAINGASLLLSNISWLLVTYLDRTLVEIMSSPEGISLCACIAACLNMSREITSSAPCSQEENTDLNEEELMRRVSLSPKDLRIFLKKLFGILLRTLIAVSSDCLQPSSSVWIDFLDLRLEFSLLRRKILSVCGVGRWDETSFGMPLSQHFLGYAVGLFALHSIQILKSLRFGFLSEMETNSILHFWYVLGSFPSSIPQHFFW